MKMGQVKPNPTHRVVSCLTLERETEQGRKTGERELTNFGSSMPGVLVCSWRKRRRRVVMAIGVAEGGDGGCEWPELNIDDGGCLRLLTLLEKLRGAHRQ